MKKLIAFSAAILLMISSAAAAPDLSGYTYDELIALRHYFTLEIMRRPEWKEVTVPSGNWIVGVDIPAGSYSISPSGTGAYIRIIDDKGNIIVSQGVRNESNSIGKISVKDAYTIEIETGSLIFAPSIVLEF